jgi:hypothetical protein
MRIEKQINLLLCFSLASNLAFKICYELNCSGIMRTMVVQIITVFHNRWIDYYYLVGEINIYNTDAKGRKTKQILLI